MENLNINSNRLMLNGTESLALQQKVSTIFDGEIIFPFELPKVLQKVLTRDQRTDCDKWDCFIASYQCTCEGDCDGCEGIVWYEK